MHLQDEIGAFGHRQSEAFREEHRRGADGPATQAATAATRCDSDAAHPAEAGPADLTHLILRHEGGASAAVTVTLSVPDSAAVSRLELWGPAGRSTAPVETGRPIAPLRTALAELAANARAGQTSHPCDVQFGRAVGQVLISAQEQLG